MLPERARDGADDLVRADDLAREAIATPGIEGVTLLGGEPFAQADALAELAEQVREAGLSVLVFSGFTLEELRARGHGASRLLAATDLLIDGPYDRSSPDRSRRWIGSANQRLHVLGARQPWIDPRWKASPSLEIRLARGVLTVNGWPPAAASVEAGR
jgi:anaerobic ribonucleoside-triphosphate reductase activating protein